MTIDESQKTKDKACDEISLTTVNGKNDWKRKEIGKNEKRSNEKR